MRILLTGNKGFVGSHIEKALSKDHEIVGLDVRGSFTEWVDDMDAVMDTDIDTVIHAGAISNNQSNDPDIYLWNAYGTYLLAKKSRDIPFVFFSSFVVSSTVYDVESRTPYGWTKAIGEDFVLDMLPDATIVRPGVMWGNEVNKAAHAGSVPWQLASHNLKYLIRGWKRRYVHVSDVVEAMKICLADRPKGVFELSSRRFWTNEELSKLVEWKGYQWIDKSEDMGHKFKTNHDKIGEVNLLPGWTSQTEMDVELPRLERELNYAR